MAKFKKKSVLPVYSIALVWVLFTLFHSLSTVSDYVSVILLSAVAFIVAKGIWPTVEYEIPDVAEPDPPFREEASEPKQEPKTETEEKPEEPPSTGDPKLDALILEKNRAISEMRRLNDAIQDKTISDQIDDLEESTSKIIDHVVKNPEKLPQIRRFMNFYLPTTLKILNTYDRMGSVGVSGENIDGTMDKIETMMNRIVTAFHNQLDALFREEAMDISSDITVLENLLAQEGFGDTQTSE